MVCSQLAPRPRAVRIAAAERLAAVGAKDAKLKQDMALKRFARLRGELQITRRFRMFGTGQRSQSRFGLPLGGGTSTFGPPAQVPGFPPVPDPN